MLEKVTKQKDDTDIQNVDKIDGGMENLDSILAEMQEILDDRWTDEAQLHNNYMAANKQAPAIASIPGQFFPFITVRRLPNRYKSENSAWDLG